VGPGGGLKFGRLVGARSNYFLPVPSSEYRLMTLYLLHLLHVSEP
jgi:hypothetical protein